MIPKASGAFFPDFPCLQCNHHLSSIVLKYKGEARNAISYQYWHPHGSHIIAHSKQGEYDTNQRLAPDTTD